ncbi:hypothetical protein AB0A69_23565 [Streptomyces sp. NPDC045431]|uniref:hypothetical protein n=1 Tax=Streptomyces sp. NPDC045431 TaxID=3155613 RepID=UPI0033EFEE2D
MLFLFLPGRAAKRSEPDRECLARLVELLARHSPDDPDTECSWAQAAIHDAVRHPGIAEVLNDGSRDARRRGSR